MGVRGGGGGVGRRIFGRHGKRVGRRMGEGERGRRRRGSCGVDVVGEEESSFT